MFEKLVKAIQEVNEKEAKSLIERMSQYELNATDKNGRNAFHLAVLKQMELKNPLAVDKKEAENIQ
jgi:hypothetical protein